MKWWTKDFWKLEPMDEVEQSIFGFLSFIILGTAVLSILISIVMEM